MLLADVGGSNRLVCARLRVSARAVRAAGRAAVRAAVQAAVRAAVRAPCARKRRGRGMRAAPLAKVSCSPKSKMTARRPSRPAGPGSAHASPSRGQSGRRGGSCSPSVAHAGRGGANSVMLQPCPTPAQNSLPEPARTRIVTNGARSSSSLHVPNFRKAHRCQGRRRQAGGAARTAPSASWLKASPRRRWACPSSAAADACWGGRAVALSR